MILGIGAYAVLSARRRRRWTAIHAPFPEAWENILDKNLPVYGRIPESLRLQLHLLIQTFIYDKTFEGCGGLVIDDEIRVTVAAQACMLLLNREGGCYPKLRTILVYPSSYVAKEKESFTREAQNTSARLGESWTLGTVVLAWDSVKGDALHFTDGHNVTMHEFAHQLDQEDGAGDGVPVLGHFSAYTAWAKTFSEEFERLQLKVMQGRDDVLYDYGAVNPAEFFAVATETFFEKPGRLREMHPELYKRMQEFYRVNPEEWMKQD
ncbi:zinc-dependent peptidase [bacterium]|nr:zinc-dependent peptidase [bacterium]